MTIGKKTTNFTPPMDGPQLPTVPVHFNLVEIGFLIPFLLPLAERGDGIARGLFRKPKATAIAAGVEWRYGSEPWEAEP